MVAVSVESMLVLLVSLLVQPIQAFVSEDLYFFDNFTAQLLSPICICEIAAGMHPHVAIIPSKMPGCLLK